MGHEDWKVCVLNQRPRHSAKDELAQLAVSETSDHEELRVPTSGRLSQLNRRCPRAVPDQLNVRNDAVPGELARAVTERFGGCRAPLRNAKKDDPLGLFKHRQSERESPGSLGRLLPSHDDGATDTPRR